MFVELIFWAMFAFVAITMIGSVITIAITIIGGLLGIVFGVIGTITTIAILVWILKDIFG